MVDVINILFTWLIDLASSWHSVSHLCGNNSILRHIKKDIHPAWYINNEPNAVHDEKHTYSSLKYGIFGVKKANYKSDTGLKIITIQVFNLHSTCVWFDTTHTYLKEKYISQPQERVVSYLSQIILWLKIIHQK
jgi:hypothetical protein